MKRRGKERGRERGTMEGMKKRTLLRDDDEKIMLMRISGANVERFVFFEEKKS